MVSLLRAMAGWPLPLLHALGAPLGWLAWALSPTYRRRLADNARLAGLDAGRRRAAVAEAGRLVTELPWVWLRRGGRPIGERVRWHGEALIDEALAAGRGIVILTPHLGSFEVCAQAYAERYGARSPVTVLYRPAKQAWLRELEDGARNRPGMQTAPAALSGVRQMLRALRAGQTVGLLPDQVPPAGLGAWAPFFGRPAYTMTLAARLVQQTGAPLLTMWAERLPRGAGWRLHVAAPEQPLPVAGADDAEAQAAAAAWVNREMERLIAACPQQYLWGYHRYKQPPVVAGGLRAGA